jgi:hypothetical protein
MTLTLILIIGTGVWVGVACVMVAACVLAARADREMLDASPPKLIRLAPAVSADRGRSRRGRLVRA